VGPQQHVSIVGPDIDWNQDSGENVVGPGGDEDYFGNAVAPLRDSQSKAKRRRYGSARFLESEQVHSEASRRMSPLRTEKGRDWIMVHFSLTQWRGKLYADIRIVTFTFLSSI
jgi:hypothetical protein